MGLLAMIDPAEGRICKIDADLSNQDQKEADCGTCGWFILTSAYFRGWVFCTDSEDIDRNGKPEDRRMQGKDFLVTTFRTLTTPRARSRHFWLMACP